LRDPTMFASAQVVDWGWAVEWRHWTRLNAKLLAKTWLMFSTNGLSESLGLINCKVPSGKKSGLSVCQNCVSSYWIWTKRLLPKCRSLEGAKRM